MRKTSARVIVNRAALTQFGQQLTAGVGNFCASVVERADVPDRAPYGKGLIASGGWAVYYNGRKLGGPATKPRVVRLGKGIVGIAGYGAFYAHFVEHGTTKMAAEPFLMPAWLDAEGKAVSLIREGMHRGFES